MTPVARWMTIVSLLASSPTSAFAQEPPDRVLTGAGDAGPGGPLRVDLGAVGLWQKLRKLTTTGSVLYTVGHPDDEEAGVLTLLGRGLGVRTALLTLTRGEGGANALGPELFDALGVLRTEELRLAGRYYGLDDQYFTTAVDYGYSKTLDEALRSWDTETILADLVRSLRVNRPLVVISRWHGSERDGHGHHQVTGVLTTEAVLAAADPARFPRQIVDEGIRPWRVRALYRGRLRPSEPADLTLDPSRWSPWLGESYRAFGAHGLSLQRSQTSGRVRRGGPATPARYERLPLPWSWDVGSEADDRRVSYQDPFHGMDTSIGGIGTLTGESLDPETTDALAAAERHVRAALERFDLARPDATIPSLVAALDALRRARATLDAGAEESAFLLAVKERQTADALAEAAGVRMTALASFRERVRRDSPADPVMGPAVPGARLAVHVSLTAATPMRVEDVGLRVPDGWAVGPAALPGGADVPGDRLEAGERAALALNLDIPDDAEPTRPWYERDDVRANHYRVRDSTALLRGSAPAPVRATAELDVGGALLDLTVPVRTLRSEAPFGESRQPLEVAPLVSLEASPGVAVLSPNRATFSATVEVTSNARMPVTAEVRLDLPPGWSAQPQRERVVLEALGDRRTVSFDLSSPGGEAPRARIEIGARATVAGRTYREGIEVVDHPDLRVRRLYANASLTVQPVDVALEEGLRVGYVMGVGDDVPAAIEALGAEVALLGPGDLRDGELSVYRTIVIGTRAYAVRHDLTAANGRLLDWARDGGNLVVLYQTPEYTPETQAPFPATLPGNAEEVSEEDAPVRLLAPQHRVLSRPNRIGRADFEGWIEQRGSKFFATWSSEYTPLVETHDTGQAPQRGIWLTARLGEGRFTYVALALHRQLPYGVPGAYRILANVLTPDR